MSDERLGNGLPPERWDIYGFCVGDWDGDGWPDVLVTRQDLIPAEKSNWQSSVCLYRRE